MCVYACVLSVFCLVCRLLRTAMTRLFLTACEPAALSEPGQAFHSFRESVCMHLRACVCVGDFACVCVCVCPLESHAKPQTSAQGSQPIKIQCRPGCLAPTNIWVLNETPALYISYEVSSSEKDHTEEVHILLYVSVIQIVAL